MSQEDSQIIIRDDYGNRFFEIIYQGDDITCYDYTKRRFVSKKEIMTIPEGFDQLIAKMKALMANCPNGLIVSFPTCCNYHDFTYQRVQVIQNFC